MKLKIFTFGCKVNQYESQLYREYFSAQGYEITNSHNFEICLINLCCVTKKAENEVFRLMRKLISQKKKIWLTGCIADRRFIEETFPSIMIFDRQKLLNEIEKSGLKTISRFNGHSRAFIKVVDGCESFCSYCIIPYVRGKIRSRPIDEIISEIKCLSENGFYEIVLTGINLGYFGKDTGLSLSHLIREIRNIDTVKRFRLSSIELQHITDELIKELRESPNFCPSFHIPLQSGSDRILEKMRRPYRYKDYKEKIELLAKTFSNCTFTTDIMIGFPGESETDFRASLKAIEENEFLKVHLFRFSNRPKTYASTIEEHLPDKLIKQRMEKAFDMANNVATLVKKKFIGYQVYVLVEQYRNQMWFGYSEQYLPVYVDSNVDLTNRIVRVKIEKTITDKENISLVASY